MLSDVFKNSVAETSTDNPYRSGDKSNSFIGATAEFEKDKQDWTGTKTVEGSADYGQSGSVSIAGCLPSDYGDYLDIPEDSVKVSDPDSVLETWNFDGENGTVTFKFKDDASKIGKSATISATVSCEKYNDYTGSVVLKVTGEVPAATYKVTVTDDGNGTAKASVTEAEAGTKVTLTATPKDGYEFDKWVSDDVTVEDGAFEMPAKDVSVKATFKKKAAPVTTYAITFDANGGTGTMDKQSAEAGATVALTANAFTRDGYTFDGWNTAKDGSGTAYADKAEVKVEGDMTLYAQWKATSKSNTAKTGDTVIPMTAVAAIAVALAAGVLFVARRKMN